MHIYIYKSALFILCQPWKGWDNYSYAYIIELQLKENDMVFDRLFKIQGVDSTYKYFGSIAINENKLIAIEKASMTINEYDLSKLN